MARSIPAAQIIVKTAGRPFAGALGRQLALTLSRQPGHVIVQASNLLNLQGRTLAFAQGRTASMASNAFDFLAAARGDDGGWGYEPAGAGVTEVTAAVALAGRGQPAGQSLADAAWAWLRRTQHADGGWGLGAADPQSGWPTAWAALALAAGAADDRAAVARGQAWLAGVRVLRITGDELQAEFRRRLAVDPNLNGWPWWPEEAGWIEPTALTLLALADSPALVPAGRLAEAARYLADRRCQGGGWNFGNPVMLGGNLPPRAHPTAWALLALDRVAPELIRDEDWRTLTGEARHDGGSSALALALLTLRRRGQDDAELAGRLAARQGPDGGWDANPYHTALALLAQHGKLT
jgi:hypothetical protein